MTADVEVVEQAPAKRRFGPVAPVVAAHMSAWGGRRFLLTVGAGLVNSLLVWYAKIGPGEYVALTTLTVGAYIGANTFQKREQIKAGNTDQDKSAPTTTEVNP